MAGIAEQLRQAVLLAAIQGKLTEQLPEDGNARDLLAEIQAEKAKLIAEKKIKKEKPFLRERTTRKVPATTWQLCVRQCSTVIITPAKFVDAKSRMVPFYICTTCSTGKVVMATA